METRTKIIISVVALAVAFASGRWLAPTKVKIEKEVVVQEKIVEVEKKSTQTDKDQEKHKKTVKKEITRPDGTKEVITTTEDDTNTKQVTKVEDDKSKQDDTTKVEKETKEVTRSGSPVTISLLTGASLKFENGLSAGPVVYGASVSKPILGPISMGLFGLNNGTFGVSVGLIF
jgi:lipopolysaccharide export LptBFGC system permease protein LptF